MDLSVLIPSRNEMFLSRTIDNILENIKGDTEVIAVCDGSWPDPPVKDHPRVTLIHHSESVGQRAATNEAARLSRAKFVMKCDAHCAFDKGFDVKLMADCEPDWTVVPRMYNLHAFNWKCKKCGNETYQGPTPTECKKCHSSKGFDRVMYWRRRESRKSDSWRFDKDLHFQYWGGFESRPEAKADIIPTMSLIGAAWFMHRDRYWELDGMDEKHGSWGQMGTEIACKSWLSGGKLVTNKKTWFAHMFRTQGGDFGFPYQIRGSDQEKARKHSRDIWRNGKWPKAKYSLEWLIKKFAPVPGWEGVKFDGKNEEVPSKAVIHGGVMRSPGGDGVRNSETIGDCTIGGGLDNRQMDSGGGDKKVEGGTLTEFTDIKNQDDLDLLGLKSKDAMVKSGEPNHSKALVYYTDNRAGEYILYSCRKQLLKCMEVWKYPIIAVSQYPIVNFGKNIVLDLPRSVLSLYTQVVRGLEETEAEYVFLIEHDLLYHPSHFDFTPPRNDRFYYDRNRWPVCADTGKAVFYQSNDLSMLCASRRLLLKHFRKARDFVAKEGFQGKYGFSPPKGIPKDQRVGRYECYMSKVPTIDIRHANAFTRRRMNKDEFRSEKSCRDWQESDGVPGWGKTLGRFDQFLKEVTSG